jgi:Uncharacterized membrane protein (DUF2298)
MSLLRAAFLDFLVCFYLIGGAVLFRRIFPRESPWLGFFIPTLVVMFTLNFIEHFVALPELNWLLPITLGGLFWCMIRPGVSWDGLRLPAVLFVIAFTFCLIIRGLHPEIPCWTEGLANLNRMLDFCLGDTVPPTDSWLPPYDHGGYYTFQHYGASIMKRLFNLDIGTGYNLGYTFLNAWICLMAAGAAFALTEKKWVAAAVMLVVIANYTGGAVIMMLFNHTGVNFQLSYDLHHGWADEHNNPMWKLLAADPYQQRTRLFTPGNNIYNPEFHANMGGNLVVLLSLFAGAEVMKKESPSNWPWVLLVVLPVMILITLGWIFPVVAFLCVGTLTLAFVTSRRPKNGSWVAVVSVVAIALIWPSVDRIMVGSYSEPIHWTTKEEHTYIWLFVEQWWPVYLPWFSLCFVWFRLSLMARWWHIAVPVLLLIFEFFTVGDRSHCVEKLWSALFCAGLVGFVSLAFMQKAWPFRILTVFMLACAMGVLWNWWLEAQKGVDWGTNFFRLEGDGILYYDSQKKRLLQVARQLHNETILSGRPSWGYSQAPAVALFSENKSYVGWGLHEQEAGNGDEPDHRAQQSNDFYDGKMSNPLPFLAANNIAAVLIWPDEAISDDILAKLKTQLSPAYYYVDCKEDEEHNAGLFLRLPAASDKTKALSP